MSNISDAVPKRRLRLIALFFAIAVGLLGARLVEFQVVAAEEINRESYAKRAVTMTLGAQRGEIMDTNGEILAKTVFRYDVNVAPNIVGPIFRDVSGVKIELSVAEVAAELSSILEMDISQVFAVLSGEGNYANLKKKVDAESYRAIKELNIPWIFFDTIADRLYPSGAVAGNLIGFTGSDGEPLAGLERQYNTCMAGVDGQESYERSVTGIRIPSSAVTVKQPREGGDLLLSIDSDLQYYAQQVLTDAVATQNAEYAVAVVVEVETGRLLAAAEAPSVDPNDFLAVPDSARGSRVFQASYEPGSTMKAVSAAIAIDTGTADAYTQIVAEDTYRLPFGETIDDSFNHPPRNLTLAGVLAISSNVGITKIGENIAKDLRYGYMLDFGFGTRTSLNFEGESGGLLLPSSKWDGMTERTVLFGQGMAVTPIQMAYAYQAIANDGVRLDPVLVEGCQLEDGSITMVPNQQQTAVVSPDSARLTMDMLEKVVEIGGVGKTAAIGGYRVAGKTGTAQIADSGIYGSKFAISFFGMAPAEDPKYVVAVMIHKPQGASNSAGATPPFKSIMAQTLRHYRVPPSTTASSNIPTEWE